MSEIVGLHSYDGVYIVLAHVVSYSFMRGNDVCHQPTNTLRVNMSDGTNLIIFNWGEHTPIAEFLHALHLYLETRT